MDESRNSFALVPHAGDRLTEAVRWVEMETGERRRRATAACADRDAGSLWELTRSHMTLHSKSSVHLSPHTAEAYSAAIRFFVRDTQGYNLLHLTQDQAAVLIRRWESDGLSPSTVQVRLGGVRALYRALRWAGAISGDPLSDVRITKDTRRAWERRSPYSPEDVQALRDAASGEDLALVLLAGHAGLRAFECTALEWRDVEWTRKRVHVREGKGRKEAYVTASPALLTALSAIRQSDGYVLSYRTTEQARNRMKALCARADIPYMALHSLRHACGTALQRELGDISKVARHLRHASPSTSEIYIHYAEDAFEQSVGQWN